MATSKKVEGFTLELTRDEAVALMLLKSASTGAGFTRQHLDSITQALLNADKNLHEEQYAKWKKLGRPEYQLGE